MTETTKDVGVAVARHRRPTTSTDVTKVCGWVPGPGRISRARLITAETSFDAKTIIRYGTWP